MSEKKKIILCGCGGVGKAFIKLLAEKQTTIQKGFGIEAEIVAVVDSTGAAIAQQGGFDLNDLFDHLSSGQKASNLKRSGQEKVSGLEAIKKSGANLLIETTPTNLGDGEPALSYFKTALSEGMDIVTANKAPLVLRFGEIQDLARSNGCRIKFSGATAAALPTIDLAEISLAGTQILSIEGILNGTSNYILSQISSKGYSYEEALLEAQKLGIAETDPSMDVQGWDTCNKIVLIVNTLFHKRFTPQDVMVTGIEGIRPTEIQAVQKRGKVLKLIGSVEWQGHNLSLTVSPKELEREHPLAGINGSEKGISYLTDSMGRVNVTGGKSSPVGAAAALLKDLLNLYRQGSTQK